MESGVRVIWVGALSRWRSYFGVGRKSQDMAQQQTWRMFSSPAEFKRDCLPIPSSLAGILCVQANGTPLSPVGGGRGEMACSTNHGTRERWTLISEPELEFPI